MTGADRIKKAIRGEKVDRVAIAGWMHTPLVDRNVTDFVRKTIQMTDYYGWDLVKVMTNGHFMTQAYGADIDYSIDPESWSGTVLRYPVQRIEDVRDLSVIEVKGSSLEAEVEVVRLLKEHYGDKLPILATVFNPITSLQETISSLNPFFVKHMMVHHKKELHKGLENMTQTVRNYMDALVDAGCDGFFFASQYCMRSIISTAQFEEFCKPYDVALLNHIKDKTWFNMLHVHGSADLLMKEYLTYPVQAVNWENAPAGVAEDRVSSIAQVREMTDMVLMSGIDQTSDFYVQGNNRDVVKKRMVDRLNTAKRECTDGRFVFAPGCTLPLDAPDYLFTLIREAAEDCK